MTTNIKPPADLFDLSKLSESSLRKYQVYFHFIQSYFRINCTDENMNSKISEHFHTEFKVDTTDVIEKFLELKKEEKDKYVFLVICRRRPRNPRAPQ